MCRDIYDLWSWNAPTKYQILWRRLGSSAAWGLPLWAASPLSNNLQNTRKMFLFCFFKLLTVSVKDIKYEMEAALRDYECTGWFQSWKMLPFYLAGARLCSYFCRWGQRQISSVSCKFNFTPFFTRQQISSTIWKSDSVRLYSSRLLFWKVINDLQMFGLSMNTTNKSGLAGPEGRGCWQAAPL